MMNTQSRRASMCCSEAITIGKSERFWLVLIGLCFLQNLGSAEQKEDFDEFDKSTGKWRIGYIRQDIPDFDIPPYCGARYQDMIPDTLDIAERAELAIHALTAATNPAADYEMYFYLRVFCNPPVMVQDFSSWCQPKYMEALPLLRIACGSTLNNHVDPVWMRAILKGIGPDGLFYFPFQGRPWFHQDLKRWYPQAWQADGTPISPDDPSVDQITHPQPTGRILGALTNYYLRDKNPMWKEIIEKMIDRYLELAIKKADYAYYPRALLLPDARIDPNVEMPQGFWGLESGGRLIKSLAGYYRLSSYIPARELAGKLTRYLRYHANYYDPETARYIRSDLGPGHGGGGHFHAHTIGLLGMLEYASAVDDRELLEYVKRGYLYGRNHERSSALVGFFPEWLSTDYTSCETCAVADMIALALKLTQARVDDYYDDADRWTRNQFVENQLTKADWVYRLAQTQPKARVAYNESDERAVERNIGGFAGWATGNDWLHEYSHKYAIMNCCTGNAARTLYYIWESILDYDNGKLRVNLLLNRASKWADVYSYIPCKGRVDIKMKQACHRVSVRMPEWIETGSHAVICEVNGKPSSFGWEGRFANVGQVQSGEIVSVKFPISERSVRERLGNIEYTLVVKGNTVVSIEPRGKYCPLYQRDRYRQDQVRWRKVERFASNESIAWHAVGSK